MDARTYWINLASLDRTACGIFLLSSLNPSIGTAGDSCVNFVTHLRGRDRPLFHVPDEELLARYRDDFRAVFGFDLEPFWTHVVASADVLAGVRARLPQPADPERLVGERVFRGKLPDVPVDRLDRHRARLRPRDRCRGARGPGAPDRPARRGSRGFRLAAMPRA